MITLPHVPQRVASVRFRALWDMSQKMVSMCFLTSMIKKKKQNQKLTVDRQKSVVTEWHFSGNAELWKAKRHQNLFSFIWLLLE